MRADTLEILRCPFCGGRLAVVPSLPHQREGDEIVCGILGCYCCIYPVVAGIPVLHLEAGAKTACAQIEAGHPELAERTMFGLAEESSANRFARVSAASGATYRETVEALGPDFEGGYFFYRFSNPRISSPRRSCARCRRRAAAAPSTSAADPAT